MRERCGFWLVLFAVSAGASGARAADWSDNAFRYAYGGAFREPMNPERISKNVLSFTRVDGNRWGRNFLNVDMLFSSANDPASNSPGVGATEVYAIYRHDLSLNALAGQSTFSVGPVRDVLLVAGGDANTKNSAFAPSRTMPVIGASVALAVPGSWSLGVLAVKEWNSNALATGGVPGGGRPVVFDLTLMVTSSWRVPLAGDRLSFEGFANVTLPKGRDGFGLETRTELLLHSKVTFDLGTLFGSNGYQVGFGWQYWLNKFGNDHTLMVGAEESAFFLEAAVHL